MLDGVFWGNDADTIDDELSGRVMGNEARRQVHVLLEP